ncbi:MAG: 3-methyl-2-oxobutanoate hydroxymethyltransferase [Candidatus Omnitrophica bacterium]|jgi:3-methyl-2-oxobutanoate hydroxymethyltransferase|nr:3-methyl-2-oxobutanoate hydroxymethyltransferase [Candidatus Omnitrophota bacterium]
MGKITIEQIKAKKGKGKITMLTCYDYSFAKALDATDLDIVLIGDSLANVVLGLEDVKKVSINEMLNHTKAVTGAITRSLVVADMPYASYQKNPKKCLYYAEKFIKAGADAVKIEWFESCPEVISKLVKNKIPVMGHIGLTPQTAHLLGGFKVQGKDKESAKIIMRQAETLCSLGVFAIVLECVPYQLSRYITQAIDVPTIGIGAGKFCNGQVLVLYDVIGLYKRIIPKFVRAYADFSLQTEKIAERFIKDVKSGKFPAPKETFSIKSNEWKKMFVELKQAGCKANNKL